MENQKTQTEIKDVNTRRSSPPICYADSIRRWTFETRGGEIWVCEGEHDESDHCDRHSREVFAAEAVEIIDKLRSELLRMYYSEHNVESTREAGSTQSTNENQKL